MNQIKIIWNKDYFKEKKPKTKKFLQMFTITAVGRFLRRFFNVRCRETNTELNHAWHKEIIQITEETPRQMGLYLDIVV